MSEGNALDAQHEQWQRMYAEHPDMFGAEASKSAKYAIELFQTEHVQDLLELGAGQGRDTLPFVAAGFRVVAVDYEGDALRTLADKSGSLTVVVHDVRMPLPFEDSSFDAVYSHMLFNMALSTEEIGNLGHEVRRVLRPHGAHVYTVRHVGDQHFGTGVDHGDSRYEHGGFIVHFFDRTLVDRLADGFSTPEVAAFEEGELPRRLWRVTQRKA
jgi:SAM-dependent methyltransferase